MKGYKVTMQIVPREHFSKDELQKWVHNIVNGMGYEIVSSEYDEKVHSIILEYPEMGDYDQEVFVIRVDSDFNGRAVLDKFTRLENPEYPYFHNIATWSDFIEY